MSSGEGGADVAAALAAEAAALAAEAAAGAAGTEALEPALPLGPATTSPRPRKPFIAGVRPRNCDGRFKGGKERKLRRKNEGTKERKNERKKERKKEERKK